MTMNMCIIMTMNIYITKANEEYLRGLNGEGESMSGYINRLLENARGATPLQVAKESFDETLKSWPTGLKPPRPRGVTDGRKAASKPADEGSTPSTPATMKFKMKKPRLVPPITITGTPNTVHYKITSANEVCKHGADPSLCKFAKPGKKCK